MINATDLDPEIAAIGMALGLLKPAGSGHELDTGFFVEPWNRVGQMLSNETQRAALVTAMAGLLPPATPSVNGDAMSEGARRACYPLLEENPHGQVYLVVQREGSSPGAPITMGLLAEGVSADGSSLHGELTLLRTEGQSISVTAASPDHPLRLEARAPLNGNGAGKQITAQALVVAPPNETASRFRLRLDGLTGPDGQPRPFTFDPLGQQQDSGRLALTLLQLFLDDLNGNAGADLQRLAGQLPTLLGLDNGLPPLPLDRLTQDPAAFRGWLASLAQATAADGRNGLTAWLDAAGQLAGAPALGVNPPTGTESDPLVIYLLRGTDTPEIALTAWLRTEPASGGPALVLGLRTSLNSAAAAAAVRGEAVLLALPLTGVQPATLLESLDLRVDAPQGVGPLLNEANLKVGHLRAGLRYALAGAPSKLVPLLELLDVNLMVGGQNLHFDRLDLTDAQTLSTAAQSTLDQVINAGLGAGSSISPALRTLLGLGTTPAINLTLLTTAPTQALADYYRRRRATSDGWKPVLAALGTLLGTTGPVSGDGTVENPWKLALDNFIAPAGALAGLSLALWDEGAPAEPRLCLALRVDAARTTNGTDWQVFADVKLLTIDLRAGGDGARWLGGGHAEVRLTPPALPEEVDGLAVGAARASLVFEWLPGQPLTGRARIEDAKLVFAGVEGAETLELGEITLPPPQGFDFNQPDLGLGLDPQILWDAARLLLSHLAGTAAWTGPTAQALLAMLGIIAPGPEWMPQGIPPLPVDGDLKTLLGEPLEAVRLWLWENLVTAEELPAGDQPFLLALLDLAQAVLTDSLPLTPFSGLPAPDVPIYGAGLRDDPWAIPLQAAEAEPVEVLAWLEPDGPPEEWAGVLVNVLLDGSEDFGTLMTAVDNFTRSTPYLSALMVGREPLEVAAALSLLADTLAEGDGIVALTEALPEASGWTSGEPVAAAHHLLPRAARAVQQVRDRVTALTSGKTAAEWAVVLLAPGLAGENCWEDLLAQVNPLERCSVSLRATGATPDRVDLTGLLSAQWYPVDLADDGTAPLAVVVKWLERVINQIRVRKPGAKIILVGHSYLGLVTQAYAAAHPETILGLVALGTPLANGAITDFTDNSLAEAVRFAAAMAEEGLFADAPVLEAGLSFLAELLDGYFHGESSLQPRLAPFPILAFARTAGQTLDLHGLPALAIGGVVDASALGRLISAFAQTGSHRLPTHLAWGARTALYLPPAQENEPQADLSLRVEFGRLALWPGRPDWPNTPRLEVRARIWRDGDWLVGGPGDGTPLEARVRWAEFVTSLENVTGQADLTVEIRLHEAALRGAFARVIGLDDPRAAPLLAHLIETLDAAAPPGGRIDALLGALTGLNLIRRRSGSIPASFLADELAAMRRDAAAVLAPRLRAMLDGPNGLFGLVRPTRNAVGGGPWQRDFSPLPIELVVDSQPWRVIVRTTGSGLPISPQSFLNFTGMTSLGNLESQVRASLRVGELLYFTRSQTALYQRAGSVGSITNRGQFYEWYGSDISTFQ